MFDWLINGGFMPHGNCYLWRPDILWLHVLSDTVIALSYFSIPMALIYFVRRRPDVPFPRMITLFAMFIVLCGISHVFEIVVIWQPVYALQGLEKAATALVSMATAIALIPVIPRALAMRTPAQLQAEVDRAVDALRQSQEQLMQNEKLATLGGLVAGLSHEVSTPIGSAVMAASTVTSLIEEAEKKVAGGKLTRSEFESFMNTIAQASNIVLRNMQRADELIGSFKQVAVDQSSGERRSFNLKTYADEVLLSLNPRLKHTPHQVSLSCPDTLAMNSYPGAISQILTNLIVNSLMHAFPDGRKGRIRIDFSEASNAVVLDYADDGIGIPKENLNRIFQPFFTTKRDSGGSGLGLSIVHNLVTQTLGGSIEISSSENQGTRFHIVMPIVH